LSQLHAVVRRADFDSPMPGRLQPLVVHWLNYTPAPTGVSLLSRLVLALECIAGGAKHLVEANLECRLEKIQATLDLLVQQRTVKDWYTTEEVAKITGKAEFTVREWCRFGRLHAEKRPCGRGRSKEWMIAHAELLRYQNEGLLSLPKN
jgi:hypothetical protein